MSPSETITTGDGSLVKTILTYYKLAEQPFAVTSAARYLYLGSQHREALASLFYGTESDRGFLTMIAEPGMGKTSLLVEYLSKLWGKARTAFVYRSDLGPREFMRQILIDLQVDDVSEMDLQQMHVALTRVLTAEMGEGRRVVLVIDEAQNLARNTLEAIRMLSNFETPWAKVMTIVLAGQAELANHLDNPELSQLRQRISMVIRIEPFSDDEVNKYIDHRLTVAGNQKPSLFTVGARKLIAEYSRGIPRNINNICFNAISLGYALQRETIDRDIIAEVIADLDLASLKNKNISWDSDRSRFKPTTDVADDPRLVPFEQQGTIVAGGSGKDSKPRAPITSGVAQVKSPLGSWISRLSLAGVLLLVLVGLSLQLFQRERRAIPRHAGTAVPLISSKFPNEGSADSKVSLMEYTPYPAGVMPGQSLSHIMVEKISPYIDDILEQFRGLDGWLIEPLRVHFDRGSFIAPTTVDSGNTQRTVEKLGSPPNAGGHRQ